MTTVYDKFDAHFPKVSAYALIYKGKALGKIVVKYPKDGAGRLHTYIHIHGTQMQTAFVGGYGYDKSAAALQKAMDKLPWGEIEQVCGREFKQALADIPAYLNSQNISSAFYNSGIDCFCVI